MGLLTPKDEAMLALGLGLLSSKGSFGNALGQAGMLSLNTFNQAQDRERVGKMRELQEEMARMNMETAKRQQAQMQRADEFRNSLQSPMQQNVAQALGGGGGPTVANAQKLQPVDPNQALMFDAMKAGLVDPVQYIASQQKDKTPIKLGKNDRLLAPGTYQELVPALPDEGKEDEFVRRMKAAGIDPESSLGRSMLMDKLRKDSTHSPAVQVSYGAPVAGVNEKGDPVFFQPSKDGRTAPAIVQGVKPAPQNRDTKLPAELQRMQIAGDAMGALLNDYEAMLKKHNPRDPMVQANPAVRAEMQSLKRNLELQFKELQALGALAGPDIEIMRQALSDPFTFSGAYYGREGLLSQVQQARSLLQKRKDAVMRSQGQTPSEQIKPPKAVKRTGSLNGRKVVEYEDGSVEYAD